MSPYNNRHRFTPTCVGTTASLILSVRARTVHPHVRGDNNSTADKNTSACGSPPRAWGQQPQIPRGQIHHRFTPTCVGTTWTHGGATPNFSVHPHVRGDNGSVAPEAWAKIGSPPRAWGQPPAALPRPRPGRFTPTCVGTTMISWTPVTAKSVHPHVRGDNMAAYGQYKAYVGSPPRAWGQPLWRYIGSFSPRFTPTCVGTT